MPKPKKQFVRPSINLGSGSKRAWRETSPEHVRPGDVWAQHGLVHKVSHIPPENLCIMAGEARYVVHQDAKLLVFTEVDR